jgi:hypothetical protein
VASTQHCSNWWEVSESVNGKSRIGEFKLACKKRGCTGTELALLTRSVQLKQKLLELVPAAARQILDARAAILRPPAGAPAVLISKKRKGEVKDKRKAKRPSSDLDSKSDDESEESNVEEEFSYEYVGEKEGDAGIITDPNVMVTGHSATYSASRGKLRRHSL